MKLAHEFEVAAPVETVRDLLLDLARIVHESGEAGLEGCWWAVERVSGLSGRDRLACFARLGMCGAGRALFVRRARPLGVADRCRGARLARGLRCLWERAQARERLE